MNFSHKLIFLVPFPSPNALIPTSSSPTEFLAMADYQTQLLLLRHFQPNQTIFINHRFIIKCTVLTKTSKAVAAVAIHPPVGLCSMLWVSFLIWTIVIFSLIFGIAFFAFVRSNLPDVKVHRLDVYKLDVIQPKNKNKDTQLAIDVELFVNVTNNNKKVTLVYDGMHVETKIEGFSLIFALCTTLCYVQSEE
ncbi:unnamed protein product [Lactuca virosa]|uniref:Late embryogenesis abundant protein LEA-2 subgroup domain-containing protein n=1 Tax=Lactuca virosa TaxID=75947 RepID=A0AAU9N2G8_9ASTR|nr:unnamed protein product [Lactuca virosa]